jgi:hypothetical protein
MSSNYFDEDDALTVFVSGREVVDRRDVPIERPNRRYDTDLRYRRGGSKVSGVHCRREKHACR